MGAPRSMTTLSVKGREKQSQCGMRVAWAPLDPAETNRRAKSPRGCVTFAACDGESAKKQHDEHDSKDEQTRTTIRSPLAGIHIVEFWKPGEDFNLLGSLHLLSGDRGPVARVISTAQEGEDAISADAFQSLHKEMREQNKTAVVEDDRLGEIHLYAVNPDAPPPPTRRGGGDEENVCSRGGPTDRATDARPGHGGFLAFVTKKHAPFYLGRLLRCKQLVVVFDLDETLLASFTIRSIEKRLGTLQRVRDAAMKAGDETQAGIDAANAVYVGERDDNDEAANVRVMTFTNRMNPSLNATAVEAQRVIKNNAKELKKRRQEDFDRALHDREMLMMFASQDAVVLDGKRYPANHETITTSDGKEITRPVIRVKSPHCRGGHMFFTRIDPMNVETSMIVHVRPGWTDGGLLDFLVGVRAGALDGVGVAERPPPEEGCPPPRTPRCHAFVCTKGEKTYAEEMWRLLDPSGALIPAKKTSRRIVSVPTDETKTLSRAFGGTPMPKELTVVLDDRTGVWENDARGNILAVCPFMPYHTDIGPGLRGELAGAGGVLGAAQSMLEKLRGDAFLLFDKFSEFHEKNPNLPFRRRKNAHFAEDNKRAQKKDGHERTERRVKAGLSAGAARGEANVDADEDGEVGEDARTKSKTETVARTTVPGTTNEREYGDDGTDSDADNGIARPALPTTQSLLAPLMNERATDAAAIVAIQGGATRSAAGAGSRVGALISSLIRAPKPVLVPVPPPPAAMRPGANAGDAGGGGNGAHVSTQAAKFKWVSDLSTSVPAAPSAPREGSDDAEVIKQPSTSATCVDATDSNLEETTRGLNESSEPLGKAGAEPPSGKKQWRRNSVQRERLEFYFINHRGHFHDRASRVSMLNELATLGDVDPVHLRESKLLVWYRNRISKERREHGVEHLPVSKKMESKGNQEIYFRDPAAKVRRECETNTAELEKKNDRLGIDSTSWARVGAASGVVDQQAASEIAHAAGKSDGGVFVEPSCAEDVRRPRAARADHTVAVTLLASDPVSAREEADDEDLLKERRSTREGGRMVTSLDQDPEACRFCGVNDDDGMYCDGCDDVYHASCVNVKAVPESEWFCPSCVDTKKRGLTKCATAANSRADPSDVSVSTEDENLLEERRSTRGDGCMESSHDDAEAGVDDGDTYTPSWEDIECDDGGGGDDVMSPPGRGRLRKEKETTAGYVARAAKRKMDEGGGESLRNGVHHSNGSVWEVVSPESAPAAAAAKAKKMKIGSTRERLTSKLNAMKKGRRR